MSCRWTYHFRRSVEFGVDLYPDDPCSLVLPHLVDALSLPAEMEHSKCHLHSLCSQASKPVALTCLISLNQKYNATQSSYVITLLFYNDFLTILPAHQLALLALSVFMIRLSGQVIVQRAGRFWISTSVPDTAQDGCVVGWVDGWVYCRMGRWMGVL